MEPVQMEPVEEQIRWADTENSLFRVWRFLEQFLPTRNLGQIIFMEETM